MFSTWEEKHIFIIGLFEGLCPWPPARPPTPKSQIEADGEDHYYLGGRALGFIALLLILTALVKLIKGVFL